MTVAVAAAAVVDALSVHMTRPSRATVLAVVQRVAVTLVLPRLLVVARVAPVVGVRVNADGGTCESNVAVVVPKDGPFLLTIVQEGQSEEIC